MKAPARIKRRAEFLRAASSGRKAAMPGLVLQLRQRDDDGPLRVGFTATKKVGNAVVRNRIKRRLRAAAAIFAAEQGSGLDSHDLVLIGRDGTRARDFRALLDDLRRALRKTATAPR